MFEIHWVVFQRRGEAIYPIYCRLLKVTLFRWTKYLINKTYTKLITSDGEMLFAKQIYKIDFLSSQFRDSFFILFPPCASRVRKKMFRASRAKIKQTAISCNLFHFFLSLACSMRWILCASISLYTWGMFIELNLTWFCQFFSCSKQLSIESILLLTTFHSNPSNTDGRDLKIESVFRTYDNSTAVNNSSVEFEKSFRFNNFTSTFFFRYSPPVELSLIFFSTIHVKCECHSQLNLCLFNFCMRNVNEHMRKNDMFVYYNNNKTKPRKIGIGGEGRGWSEISPSLMQPSPCVYNNNFDDVCLVLCSSLFLAISHSLLPTLLLMLHK